MYSKNQFMNRLRVAAMGACLSFVTAAPPLIVADDTDIYFGSSPSVTSAPFVMFSLDVKGETLSEIKCPETMTLPDVEATCNFSAEINAALSATDAADGITFFELLRAALKVAIDGIDQDVYVGLMVNHHDTCPVSEADPDSGPAASPLSGGPGCSNGGFIMSGFQLFESGDANGNKQAFYNLLQTIPHPSDDAAHPFQGKELYFELFRYLTGQGVYNGRLGYADFGDTDPLTNLDVATGTPPAPKPYSWDAAIISGTDYISPLVAPAHHCAQLAVINLMFQASNSDKDDDSDAAIMALAADGGMGGSGDPGDTDGIDFSGDNNTFDTVIRYMFDKDLADDTTGTADLIGVQNARSYFFVTPTEVMDETVLTINDYAAAGGTTVARVLSDNTEELVDSLASVFSEVLSVSATFASASVPVNVFNKSQTLNQLFYAVFQPFKEPSWVGNVKRLKVSTDASGRLLVLDKNDVDAITANDANGGGKIKTDALTIWTDPNKLPVPSAADLAAGVVDGKDGLFVERGGAGQNIPGFRDSPPVASATNGSLRTLYFNDGNSLESFNADAVTATLLWDELKMQVSTSLPAATYADATETEQDDARELLAFARGIDGAEASTDPRAWLIGDLLHSKAVPVNYGNTADSTKPDIRLLVNSNDGFVRSIRNNVSGTVTPDGSETWAFMPRAAMGILKVLQDNNSAVKHPYGVDGTPVVYIKDVNGDGNVESADGDKVYAFFGMRRGGSAYYALDITNPDVPEFLWSIIAGDSGFSEMGLTFSTPQVGIVDWDDVPAVDNRKPVLVFAGGYDTNKDTVGTGTNDPDGRAIYMVDAATGNLIWKAVGSGTATVPDTDSSSPPATVPVTVVELDMVDSIPSEVTLVDTTGNGLDDRFYVGDTGGTVWRGDFVGDDPEAWTIRKLASVGRHETGGADRRFFHRPDYVRSTDGTGFYDGVLIGSGNRAYPNGNAIQNRFYLIKDRDTTGIPVATTLEHDDMDDLTSTTASALDGGWYFDLGVVSSGEKMLSSPLTFAGEIFFSTFEPPGIGASGVCGPSEGLSRFYTVSFANAAAVRDYDTNATGLERSTYSGSGIGGDPLFLSVAPEPGVIGGSFITSGNVSTRLRDPLPGQPILRTFWYERP